MPDTILIFDFFRRNKAATIKRVFGPILSLWILFSLIPVSASADIYRASVTMDNDVFVGTDSGYTNGMTVSVFDVRLEDDDRTPPALTLPLRWTLPEPLPDVAVNTLTIGQMMITPEDITLDPPNPKDIPYSGLLYLSHSHLAVRETYADFIGLTIGVVGPASGAESAQKSIHKMIGSKPPRGWNYQLKDEVVFSAARKRIWRLFASTPTRNQRCYDLLLDSGLSAGTLSSTVSADITFRYGSQIADTYSTPTLSASRTTNPIAIDGSWYAFVGTGVRYIFNAVALDGNTYRDDGPSVDYDHLQAGARAGLSVSWKDFSLTLAVEDFSIFDSKFRDYTRFGTLTFSWGL